MFVLYLIFILLIPKDIKSQTSPNVSKLIEREFDEQLDFPTDEDGVNSIRPKAPTDPRPDFKPERGGFFNRIINFFQRIFTGIDGETDVSNEGPSYSSGFFDTVGSNMGRSVGRFVDRVMKLFGVNYDGQLNAPQKINVLLDRLKNIKTS